MYFTQFSGRQRAGKGGKSGVILSRDRGRYIRPVLPKVSVNELIFIVMVSLTCVLSYNVKFQESNLCI